MDVRSLVALRGERSPKESLPRACRSTRLGTKMGQNVPNGMLEFPVKYKNALKRTQREPKPNSGGLKAPALSDIYFVFGLLEVVAGVVSLRKEELSK